MSETNSSDGSDRALQTSALFSLVLVAIKLAAFIATGSLLVLASLYDSLADSINSFINYRVHRLAQEDADREHPFGHGGFEVVGSLVQGLIIIFFGLSLLWESVRKILAPSPNLEYHNLPAAGVVLIFSALAGFAIQLYLGRFLKRLAQESKRSLALMADHAHYKGDAVVNIFAAIGVFSIYFFRLDILDGIFGSAGAVFLIFTGVPIIMKCFRDIVHNEAPPDLQQKIVDAVLAGSPSIKSIHHLRSRELGPYLFVDFHMKVDDNLSIKEAHVLVEAAEKRIREVIPRVDVLIHVDPESEVEDHPSWTPSYSIPEKHPKD